MEKNQDQMDLANTELLFSHLNTSVLLLDKHCHVLYLNPSAERLLGVSTNWALNKDLKSLLRQGEELIHSIQEVLQTARTMKVHEVQIFSPQGPLKFQVEIAPIGIPENPNGVVVFMQELSMVQALQEENRLLDRLSMMGTLASGLAHEIRNPLGGIRGAAEMLGRENSSAEQKEYTQIIISEVDRMNHLITQLLDFSKPKKLGKRSLNINQLLSELITLQNETIKKQKVILKQEFDPSLPPVEGHAGSLKQAFLNLIKNALEAMPKGGTLRIATGFITDYRMMVGEGRTSPMAQMVISDTGVGIPEENLPMLFTPFFTTKPQGTGLGLMMTQRILKEHEGLLRISSKVGEGSTFRILLKLASTKE